MRQLLRCYLLVSTLMLVMLVKAEDEGMALSDIVEALGSFADNCNPTPTKEQIEEVVLNKEDAKMESKCFRYCLMNQFELIEENLQIKKDTTMGMMDMIIPDDKEKAEAIIDNCNTKNKNIKDKCEAAHAHGMCILEEFKNRGVKIPEVKQ